MTRSVPFKRSAQAVRARLTKSRLLPIPRGVGDQLALQAHLSLAGLRSGVEDVRLAHSVTEVILLTKFLAEAGHGDVSHEMLLAANRAMAEIHDGATKTGKYAAPTEAAFSLLSAIVSTYDHQLQTAPLGALTDANDRLQRFKAGEPYHLLQKRGA
ncbi:hypothetical protein [Caballeronia sp. LZ035]|uniref:hypothetical protein n=1 Tax=Caballeronia sp. LZ035 TaxID=3038568 RepID=UPI002865C1AB|nr:hypothetical protein [Caballeronia sp. LZ035]MDR5762949.1 hypothetical protein [Caballeronia sp. LZ035]